MPDIIKRAMTLPLGKTVVKLTKVLVGKPLVSATEDSE